MGFSLLRERSERNKNPPAVRVVGQGYTAQITDPLE